MKRSEPPPLLLTAAAVQQGLFSKHAYEAKPAPRAPDLADDPRQTDLFSTTKEPTDASGD